MEACVVSDIDAQRYVDDQFSAPHRVLVVAQRPGDELRALQGLLGLPLSAIASISVVFMVQDGATWNDGDTNAILTNRAGEAQHVLSSLDVDHIYYLGAGVARARGTGPHRYRSSAGDDASAARSNENVWMDAGVLQLADDLAAVVREEMPDTVIVANATVGESLSIAEEQSRLVHVVDLAATKLEDEGLGRQATYRDGTIAPERTGILILEIADTRRAARRRYAQLAALKVAAPWASPRKRGSVARTESSIHIVSDADVATKVLRAYEQYRSRYRIERYAGIPVIREPEGAYLPANTVDFVERRGRAQALTSPVYDLDAWRIVPDAYVQKPSPVGVAVAVLGSAVGGLFAGFVTSIWQQYTLGGVPIGLISGVGILIAILVGARLSASSSGVIYAWAAGMIVAIASVALGGQSGDVILPANALSLTWAYGVPIALALTAAWPRRHG